MKRTLTEGGIRVPTIAWWPKTVTPGPDATNPSISETSWPLPANYRDLPSPRILTVFPFFPPSKGKRTSNRSTNFFIGNFTNVLSAKP